MNNYAKYVIFAILMICMTISHALFFNGIFKVWKVHSHDLKIVLFSDNIMRL